MTRPDKTRPIQVEIEFLQGFDGIWETLPDALLSSFLS